MKKLIYCVAAMAVMTLSGCQHEQLEPVSGNAVVTYSVGIPEVATKAAVVDDGSNINDLVYAVYRTTATSLEEVNSDNIYKVYQKNEESTTFVEGKTIVDIEFVNDQNYVVLFWAQVNDAWVKGTDFDLTSITYPTEMYANNSGLAAFAGIDFVEKVDAPVSKSVELTRPFAQINIGTTLPTNFDVALNQSEVKVKDAGAKFNMLTQKAEDNIDVTFAFAELPDGNITVNNQSYKYAAMNYIFANGNVEVTYDIQTSHGTVNNTVPAVPVEKNYRTNIIGNLLTSNAEYSVTLDKEWGTPEKVVVLVNDAESLQDAIENAQDGVETEIKLDNDVDLSNGPIVLSTFATRASTPSYSILVPSGKNVTLNLNGKTISQTKTQESAWSMIQNNGNLTIVDETGNGQLVYCDNGNGGNYVSNTITNSGTLTIESGIIINNSTSTVAENGYPHPVDNNGALIINGGTLTNNANYASMRIWCTTDDNTSVTINGGTFNGSIDFHNVSSAANKGTLTINGGTFKADTYTKAAVRFLGFGADVDEMNCYITGGNFTGEIAIRNWSGSDMNSQVFYISGGTFNTDITSFLAPGYDIKKNEDETYEVYKLPTVAKIGDAEYWSLAAAIEAVENKGTITLVADEVFTMKNHSALNGYNEGLYYEGSKGFTVDLGGYTIKQDGVVNDYLILLKNNGSKKIEITFKNGTIDAGTSAYCALCTSSTSTDVIDLNLSNIELIGDNENGAVVKVRGGTKLTVKSGTKIIGKDSYTCLEAVGSTTQVHIKKGAEFYQNGTTSYLGSLIGASYGATVYVYGGKGVSQKSALFVYSSGGIINAMGGEWTGYADGTIPTPQGDNNSNVLVVQNDTNVDGYVGASIMNVTGGTYRGGISATEYTQTSDARLNIKGGNFNADPSSYVAADFKVVTESDGTYTVEMDPVAKIGDIEYANLNDAFYDGGEITLLRDVTLSETAVLNSGITATLDLANYTITGTMHKNLGAVIENNGTLTIKNGTVSSTAANGGSAILNKGTLTAEYIIAKGAQNADGDWPSYTVNNAGTMKISASCLTSYHGCVASYGQGAHVSLENTNIEMTGISGMTSHGIYTYDNGAVTVNGGNIANNATDQSSTGASVINGNVTVKAGTFTGRIESYYGTPVLMGGTYSVNPNAKFISEGYMVAYNLDGTWSVVEEPTEIDGVFELDSAAELFWLADEVNNKDNYFEGKTVKLANDIDLNNVEWTPIGSAAKDHGFMGNFDGNGKTIKNLKMTELELDSDGYVYAGLFGVTEGTETQSNFVKNLTIENVNINTKGHIAAAAIAYPYYTTIENITVKGDVKINGGNYTAGVLAYTRRCVDAKNITIAGNSGSIIEGAQTIGGVISDIQMNGGLKANYANFKTSGVTIKGSKHVGGISGIISGQTLDGATVENVTLECSDARVGTVSGSLGSKSTIKNITITKVTGATNIVGATYDSGATVYVNGDVYSSEAVTE